MAQRVFLYYYNPSGDRDAQGNVLCSMQGLVPVERVIRSDDIIAETLRLLIRGELTAEERAGGLETEFPLEGLSLEACRLKNDVLTLTFSDPLRRTVGGACRVSLLWLQIEATAMQFSGVRRVRCDFEELFQP